MDCALPQMQMQAGWPFHFVGERRSSVGSASPNQDILIAPEVRCRAELRAARQDSLHRSRILAGLLSRLCFSAIVSAAALHSRICREIGLTMNTGSGNACRRESASVGTLDC